MLNIRRRAPLLLAAGALVLASCTSAVAIPAVVCVGEATTYLDWLNADLEPDVQDEITEPADTTGDLLEIIRDRGEIVVSTDADYAPASFLEEDGTFVGFDIDVATKIAEGLGVDIRFEAPGWDAITAGSWGGRWDVSVGSMTITTPRKEILSFTQPYYYTPAYLSASTRSRVTKVSDIPFELPSGAEVTTLGTDANCAEAIQSGRTEFDLWISAGPIIDGAIAAGSPMVKIGEPIFTENLSVSIDKSGPPHAALLFEIDKIIGEMHADGTLTTLSNEWFDEDLTKDPAS